MEQGQVTLPSGVWDWHVVSIVAVPQEVVSSKEFSCFAPGGACSMHRCLHHDFCELDNTSAAIVIPHAERREIRLESGAIIQVLGLPFPGPATEAILEAAAPIPERFRVQVGSERATWITNTTERALGGLSNADLLEVLEVATGRDLRISE